MTGIENKGQIAPAYLLFGEDEWLRKKGFNQIKSQVLQVPDDMMNFMSFEGKDVSVGDVIDAGETMPFFAERKLVSVRNSQLFKTGKKDETEKLLAWIKDLPAYSVLVFNEVEVDKRNTLYKYFQKHFSIIDCNCPKEDALLPMVAQIAADKGVQIARKELQYFVMNMPSSISYMIQELEKLRTYCQDSAVTKEVIDTICVFSLEQRVFGLLKEIGMKRVDQAIIIYQKLIESKESPILILSLIARQYRMMLQAKYLMRTQSAKQIAGALGMPYFAVGELMEQAKLYSFKQLEVILALCLEQDIAIKTGQMDQVYSIEYLMMQCMYMTEAQASR
ncbi:MAG: DNA polymerase III subunit delta [Cellulosilyticaceae bacterium]